MKLFHLSMKDAAKRLGVSESSLRNICRKHEIIRWPFRKFQQLDAHMASLRNDVSQYESLQSSGGQLPSTLPCGGRMLRPDDVAKTREMIRSLTIAREVLEQSPNISLEMAIVEANKKTMRTGQNEGGGGGAGGGGSSTMSIDMSAFASIVGGGGSGDGHGHYHSYEDNNSEDNSALSSSFGEDSEQTPFDTAATVLQAHTSPVMNVLPAKAALLHQQRLQQQQHQQQQLLLQQQYQQQLRHGTISEEVSFDQYQLDNRAYTHGFQQYQQQQQQQQHVQSTGFLQLPPPTLPHQQQQQHPHQLVHGRLSTMGDWGHQTQSISVPGREISTSPHLPGAPPRQHLDHMRHHSQTQQHGTNHRVGGVALGEHYLQYPRIHGHSHHQQQQHQHQHHNQQHSSPHNLQHTKLDKSASSLLELHYRALHHNRQLHSIPLATLVPSSHAPHDLTHRLPSIRELVSQPDPFLDDPVQSGPIVQI